MTAYEQIRNLLGTYCEVMDAADWDGLGALLAHGALTGGVGDLSQHLVTARGRS